MGDDHLTKKEKTLKRVKKQQQIIEALKYHHKPGRKSLEATKAKGGYAEDHGEGIDEDLHSKMGAKLKSLQQNGHAARVKLNRRARSIFKGR